MRVEPVGKPDGGWQQPPAALLLGRGEIHLWRAELDLPPAQVARLAQSLSPEERDRAARFHFDRDRDRFRAGRGLLRATLGRYLGREPGQVAFAYSTYGKPLLAPQPGAEDIRFNVSHSGGRMLLAVLRGCEVGVDIEWIQRDMDIASLAPGVFTDREAAELDAVPVGQRHDAFFGFWTRKESYLKAVGTGLLCPLKEFAVSLTDSRITLLTGAGETRGVAPQRVTPLDCGEGYAGAMAVAGNGWRLYRFVLE